MQVGQKSFEFLCDRLVTVLSMKVEGCSFDYELLAWMNHSVLLS